MAKLRRAIKAGLTYVIQKGVGHYLNNDALQLERIIYLCTICRFTSCVFL